MNKRSFEEEKEYMEFICCKNRIQTQEEHVTFSLNYYLSYMAHHLVNFYLPLANFKAERCKFYSQNEAESCIFSVWREARCLSATLAEFHGICILAYGNDLMSTEKYISEMCRKYTWDEWKKVSILADFRNDSRRTLNKDHLMLREFRIRMEHLLSKKFMLMPDFERFVIPKLRVLYQSISEIDECLTECAEDL